VDAREFEHLKFDRRRFSEAVLDELQAEAAQSVEVGDDAVVLHHLYTERRLRPSTSTCASRPRAGEGRHPRLRGVDPRPRAEQHLPGTCSSRTSGSPGTAASSSTTTTSWPCSPTATSARYPGALRRRGDVGGAVVLLGENDVFPEEFLPFLGLSGEPREAFLARHSDLLGVAFWTAMQEDHRAGRIPDVFPYPRRNGSRREKRRTPSRARLRRRPRAGERPPAPPIPLPCRHRTCTPPV